MKLRFEWDESKNQSNLRKHGIDFYTASLIFDDPLQVMTFDRVVSEEERWQTVGLADDEALLLVVHTFWDDDEEVVRIISARKAEPVERRRYENRI